MNTLYLYQAFGSGGEDTRVTSIVAGLRHSLAVTDKGSVCSWGSGKRGQLGYHCKAVSGCGKRGIQPLPKQGAHAHLYIHTHYMRIRYVLIAVSTYAHVHTRMYMCVY